MVSHDSVKFGGQRHCGSGDIMFLNYHVILQDHVIEELSNLIDRSPLKVNQNPVKLSGLRHFRKGDIMFLVCHIISQDHEIKRSCGFMGRSSSK